MTSWLLKGSVASANNADRGWFGSGPSATQVESGSAATTTADPGIATTHSATIVARRRGPNSDTSLTIITSCDIPIKWKSARRDRGSRPGLLPTIRRCCPEDNACFFFQAEDGIRDWSVTGVQTCALPIWLQQ